MIRFSQARPKIMLLSLHTNTAGKSFHSNLGSQVGIQTLLLPNYAEADFDTCSDITSRPPWELLTDGIGVPCGTHLA